MAKQKNAKKGKRRRVAKEKVSQYWGHNHGLNMARKAVHIARREGAAAAARFASLHQLSCKACENVLEARARRAVEADQANPVEASR